MIDSRQFELEFPPHYNRQLFADHFLDEILPDRPAWKALAEEAKPVIDQIAGILYSFVPSANERQTEDDLICPVLRLLGHEFELQAPLRTPENVKTPDYIFYRDAAAKAANRGQVLTDNLPAQGGIAIGDAKYWNRPLDITIRQHGGDALSNKNPAFQIHYYLLHSGAAWGILTNGKRWRLVHRESAHKLDVYYEVDLEESIRSRDIGRFLYFYAFFRQAAFDPGPLGLAEMLRESADYARKIGESLKEQVYDALLHLARGFLDYPPNGFQIDEKSLPAIYHNSLILLYRLLFILYAEARELLPVRENRQYRESYSLHAIKQTVANDLNFGRNLLSESAVVWPRLKQLFEIINRGSSPLKVATFNGGLFDPVLHRFLEEHAVGDAHLQQAIDKLARVDGEFVDYRDLAVRHMGTIYEGLLEFQLHPLDGQPTGSGTIELLNNKGERRITGSYYTPEPLVNHIVAHTVEPLLWQAIAGKRTDEEIADAVLSLTILDPAMGSGHFLVETIEFIARFLVDYGIVPEGKRPEEADLAFWKRRVVQSCVYGVDLNPLAVELAKLSLGLTTVAKDRPLSFLDHHLRPGNSLLGARLDKIRQNGMRVKKTQAQQRAENAEVNGQISLFDDSAFTQSVKLAVDNMWLIELKEARTINDVKTQERMYADLRSQFVEKYARLLNLATASRFGLTIENGHWSALVAYATGGNLAAFPAFDKLLGEADEIAGREHFFHWELEFPEVFFDRFGRQLGAKAGFDGVIGNPPWERVKLQENEFFASRNREIALTPRAIDRKRMIATLPEKNPALWQAYLAARERAERISEYVHEAEMYPLMGRGDANYYAIFAERALQLLKDDGRAGLLTPSGIATDDTTKAFFQHLVNHRMLAELWDFENRKAFFPEVDRRFKFSIIEWTGVKIKNERILCGFFLHDVNDMRDEERGIPLTPEDFRLFNPNTLTCPIFRRRRDADLTRAIYRHAPVLVNKSGIDEVNPWGVHFLRMFDMTNDSNNFRTAIELERDGFWLSAGNIYIKGSSHYFPLYEGKMMQMYDHRAAEVILHSHNIFRAAQPEKTTVAQHIDPDFSPKSNYWVNSELVSRRNGGTTPWQLGFKEITSPTNERTFIATALPFVGFGNKIPLIIFDGDQMRQRGACLLANLNSFVFDYSARQKIGGQTLNYYIIEQLPVIPPERYDESRHQQILTQFITERVLELCYTARDLQGFARDMGYAGPPFQWDEERRLHLRCQLDALFFLLYDLSRDDAGDILDTFPIAHRQDNAQYGRYRTKELIVAYHNAYAAGNMDAWVMDR